MAIGDVIRSFSAPGTASHGVLWDGSRLWVTDDGTDKLYHIDPSDGAVISSVDLPVGDDAPSPRGMGWDGSHIWYPDRSFSLSDENIIKIETDGTLIASIPAPNTVPSGVTWAGDDLWVGDANSDDLYRLNPSDGTVLETVDMGSFLGTVNVVGLTYAAGRLWVSDDAGDELHKMTEAVDGVDETISLSGVVADPLGISYDPSGIFWVATLSTIYALEAPTRGGPETNEELFQASYADASAADPKVTALIRPADVQRSIDTDVSNLKDGPNLYTVEAIFDIGELENLNPYNATTEKPRVFFVKDDQPGLRAGKNLLLKGYTIRDASPSVPVTCTFWG